MNESASENRDRSADRRARPEESGSRPAAAVIAAVLAVALGIAAVLSPAANLLLVIACAVAFGAGVGLLLDPPLRRALPKDRMALRILLGVTAAGALLVVLLPILARTGLW